MKKSFKLFALAATTVCAMLSCQKIQEPDTFVPEVSVNQNAFTLTAEGGSVSFDVTANCAWSIECTESWIELSAASGTENATVTATVTATKIARSALLTVASDEVADKAATITISQSGVVEISSVSAVTANGLMSAEGTTASLSASYVGLSLSDSDVVTAGFDLTADGKTATVDATVNYTTAIFTAEATGLTAGVVYTCVAWAKLNDGTAVKGESMTFSTESKAANISSVAKPTVSNTRSSDGSTASFESSFEAVASTAADTFKAGFTVYEGENEVCAIDAVIEGNTFKADAADLTVGTEYTVKAWCSINDGTAVISEAEAFTTSKAEQETIEVSFADNTVWGLPASNTDMAQTDVEVKIDDYTWTVNGGCIADGCLWLACQAKKSFGGYVKTPKFEGKTVKSITFPNDGPSSSGKAAIAIYVSEDNGATFTEVVAAQKMTPDAIVLENQKAGCIYRIENVVFEGNSGYSKTTKLTIVVE